MADLIPNTPLSPNTPPGPAPQAPGGGKAAPPPTAAPPDSKEAAPGAPEAPSEPKVSPKLQTLIRREAKALEREKQAKTQEEAIKAREQAIEAREAKMKEFESIRATNPRKALELLGMSYQDLTMAELNDGQATPEQHVKTLEQRLEAEIKAREDEKRQAAEESKKSAEHEERKAIEQVHERIAGFVGENNEKYELINFEGAANPNKQSGIFNLIYKVIDAHYLRTMDKETGIGKMMSIPEACDKVEAWLTARYEKALGLKKFSSRVAPPKELPKQPNNHGQKPPAKTLTNTMSGNSSAPPTRILTDEERIQKAIALGRTFLQAR